MISIKDIKKVIDKRAKWITKTQNGCVWWHVSKPYVEDGYHGSKGAFGDIGEVEVEEFQGKDWKDCCLPLPESEEDWIGCLCLFWDEDEITRKRHGVLMKIKDASSFQYMDELGVSWNCCRPVKPDEIKFYMEK